MCSNEIRRVVFEFFATRDWLSISELCRFRLQSGEGSYFFKTGLVAQEPVPGRRTYKILVDYRMLVYCALIA